MNTLLALFARMSGSPLGQKILYYIGSKLWASAHDAISKFFRELKQRAIDKENIKNFKEKLADPTTDEQELIDEGQNLLNGTKPNRP